MTIFRQKTLAMALGLSALLLAACGGGNGGNDPDDALPDGPVDQGTVPPHTVGSPTAGRDVFQLETFGNERFWTDAVRLPAGLVSIGVTPNQLLRLGMAIDVDKLPTALKTTLIADLTADGTGGTSPTLNSTANTLVLLNANAIVGLVVKDTNGNGTLDVASGDKVGVSCSLCHTITDGSALQVAAGGTIGKRIDGPANFKLDFGWLASLGTNTRALYPLLQLQLAAHGNTTLGRAAAGLTEASTEAQVDAYLNDKTAYPVGMSDITFDGNGDPVRTASVFRGDLAGPYGTDGTFDKQDDFANAVYTGVLDPTSLTTVAGRAFLNKIAGAAGGEIADDYVAVLAATGVTGYPFVTAAAAPTPGDVGTVAYPLGVRVDQTKLNDLNAYLFVLPGLSGTPSANAKAGADVFRKSGCTDCHNVDQTRRVPSTVVAMKTIFPGDDPVVISQRTAPLSPVQNTVASTFDDRMVVLNASLRGSVRGVAMPLLMELGRKPAFLHDNSVATLESLLDPARGANAPHPFYVTDTQQKSDLILYLKAQP
ncbi:MAG TPA: hypothetical protein VMZ90_12630 [Vicinamibacterales bacterium]|nr:hypothetical protein [Vicinamibacterales bacterium]